MLYLGERLWWSGAFAQLCLVGVWIYVVPQAYFNSSNLTIRDWFVAAILVPICLSLLFMVFGKIRRMYAAPIAKPKFLIATPAGERFHDRMIAGIWFFNIMGIPIAAIVAYHVAKAIVS